MAPADGEPAVTPIIGAILLAAILVFLLAIVQVNGVPAWNEEVEAEHGQRVLGDLQAVQSALLAVAADGSRRSPTVDLGASYPLRPPLRNPADPSGSVATDASATLSLSGAVADGEARDYWNGSRRNFTTRSIEYRPSYNYYDDGDVVIESGVLYERTGSAAVTHSRQRLVAGNRISVALIGGSLSESGTATESVDILPVSAPARSVAVTDDGTPITLTVPTNLPESAWRDLLDDELAPDGHITGISYRSGTPTNELVLTLEGGVTYELRLSKVGVGVVDGGNDPHYVVRSGDRFVATGTGSRANVVVEVRDRYDNPVSNANVTFDADVGDFEDERGTSLGRPATVRTDDRGEASVWLNVSGDLGLHEVRADIDDSASFANALQREKVDFEVRNSGGGGSDSAESFVVLDSVTPTDENGNDRYESLTLTLDNLGSSDLSVIGFQARFVLVSESGTLADGPGEVSSITLDGDAKTVDASENQQPVFFESSPLDFPTGTVTLELTFDRIYELRSQNDAVGVSFTLFYEGGFSTDFTVWEFS